MLKSLSFKGPEDSFWFVSDTHFNHDRTWIVQARGFQTVKGHDDGLIHNWNAFVKPTDTVFFLGDFHLCSNRSEDSANIFRRLNFGTFYNLWGNHNASIKQLYQDEIHTQYNLDVEVYPLIKHFGNKQVIFAGDYLEVYINGQHIILSHFSHRTWHKNGKGAWNLAGHSHNKDKEILHHGQLGKVFDCGIDGILRPYSFREIRQIMEKKDILITDHHNAETT